MADFYMQIENIQVEGLTDKQKPVIIGVKPTSQTGDLIAVNELHWAAVRGIGMDIGNMSTRDTGMVAFNEFVVSKPVDGSSEGLQSFMLMPGKLGRTVIFHKCTPSPDSGDQGRELMLQIKIENARLVHYGLSSSGESSSERLAFSYNVFEITQWFEEVGGDWKKGSPVSFILSQGKVLSAGHKASGSTSESPF
ncbi:type VI secretion system tube protein Hcp [Endozoicomonadaceae bacterium StTr2]